MPERWATQTSLVEVARIEGEPPTVRAFELSEFVRG
jgi:hypothetical protein